MSDSAEISKFSEMKSIQLYSTKDEYIFAMKEDLAEWFNSMYSTQITATNFIDKLENGVTICEHANNVTRTALKTLKFNQNDLNQAGIINIPIAANSNINRLMTPNGKSNWSGDFLLFRSDAKPQSFQSRDNISNFIRWCRYIAKVRECLMFETDDLILRKNEKNFILCLLEVARFGSKFGIQVPTIIQLEQEIEAEIEREIEKSQSIVPITSKVNPCSSDTKKHNYSENIENTNLINCNDLPSVFKKDQSDFSNDDNLIESKESSLVLSFDELDKKIGHNVDNSSLDGSFGSNDDLNLNQNFNFFNDSLENLDVKNKKIDKNKNIAEHENLDLINSTLNLDSNVNQNKHLNSSSSFTSLSSGSSISNQNEDSKDISKNRLMNTFNLDTQNLLESRKKRVVKNLMPYFRNENQNKEKSENEFVNSLNKIDNINKSFDKIFDQTIQTINQNFDPNNTSQQQFNANSSQTNLHNHVCFIADRCRCEKQFPVIKIGEGKYRIGNTKNIVFIRILRNHIMVRVGGGWDTLENYLNKHDPCRCPGDTNHSIGFKSSSNESTHFNEPSDCSSNIVLTPVQNSSVCQANFINRAQSSVSQNISHKNVVKSNFNNKCISNNCLVANKKELDFTDAKLVVERDTQGKHIVGKIIINKSNEQIKSEQSLCNNSLNNHCSANAKKLNDSSYSEMNGQNSNTIQVQNQFLDKNNSLNFLNAKSPKTIIKSSIPSSNSLNSLYQNMQKNTIRKIFDPMSQKSPIDNHRSKNSIYENQLAQIKNPSATLKINNNDLSSNPTTTGYNSLNDDSSSDFLEQTPIHIDSKVKPRVLKRYDKKRAITEAIVDFQTINQTVDESISSSNIETQNSNYVKITSSPKPPPRIKKKYRKSKTTEIEKLDLSVKKSSFESALNKHEDSLEESEYESSESLQNKKEAEKLNDSLESINLTMNNDIKVEDDSLLFNNDHGISLSLSTTSSISNINEIEQDHEFSNVGQKIGRAQWDKSTQKLDYKTQSAASPNNYLNKTTFSTPSSTFNKQETILNYVSSTNRHTNSNKKANCNLNSAKEQLYEMKKTIDAKINFQKFESSKPIMLSARTTPRKVKKRSGGRSITTEILNECENKKSFDQPSPNLYKKKTNTSMIPKFSPKINLTSASKQASSSLHNLNNCLNNDVSRPRRDSSVSSSRTCLSNNISFSSVNTTPVEFKENKAYELRKKSTLLNKIVIKNHQHDPIYSRSHPISTELTDQQVLNKTLNDNIQSLIADTAIRKRLFTKKNEKQFDPNCSIGSNGSSSFSSNSIPTGTNFILKNKILASSPMTNRLKAANTSTDANKKKYSPIKLKPPSRSRSNTDLFYELERTNSAQDLIELINNCEPPVGDLTKYKVLISECEKYDPKAKKNKKYISSKKTTQVPSATKNINEEETIGIYDEKLSFDSLNIIHHKRSRSLPSYECIPSSITKENDPTFDEEYHEETYWQDINTNF